MPVIVIAAVAAVAGDAVNYSVGRSRVAQSIVSRGWVKPQHLDRARSYFKRYGGMTITIARFVPIIRTVAPFVAGLSEMNLRRFLVFNAAGGVLWCALMVSAGFWLGKVKWVHEHLQWLSLIIVAVSLVPVAFQLLRESCRTNG